MIMPGKVPMPNGMPADTTLPIVRCLSPGPGSDAQILVRALSEPRELACPSKEPTQGEEISLSIELPVESFVDETPEKKQLPIPFQDYCKVNQCRILRHLCPPDASYEFLSS